MIQQRLLGLRSIVSRSSEYFKYVKASVVARTKNWWKRATRSQLSAVIRAEKRQRFPELFPSTQHYVTEAVKYFRLWIASILAAILFGVVGLLIDKQLLGFISTKLPVVQASDFTQLLGSLTAVLAATVGISIPVLLLVIEAISKKAEILIKPFLESTEIVLAAGFSLAVLTALIALQILITAFPTAESNARFLFLLSSTVLVFASLYEISKIILRLYMILDSTYFESVISTYLRSQLHLHLNAEVDFRMAETICEKLYSAAGFQKLVGPIVPREYVAIEWASSGWILDVNLEKFEAALNDQCFVPTSPARARGYYTKRAFERVEKGERAFFIRCKPEIAQSVGRSLLDAFSVSSVWKPTGDLRSLLDWLRDRAVSSIRVDDEKEYEQVINRYSDILTVFFGLPQLSDTTAWLFGLGSWNVSFWIISHLREIAEYASRSPNKTFVRWLAWAIVRLMSQGLQYGQKDHTGDIEPLLELYSSIFYFCLKAGQGDTATAAYDSLLDSFLDAYEFWSVGKTTPTIEEFQRRRRVYFLTIRTTLLILRTAIDHGEVDHVQRLITKLDPGELGLDITPIEPWARNESALRADLDTTHADDPKRLLLENELQIRQAFEQFHEDVKKQFVQILFSSSAYVIEGVQLNMFNPEIGNRMLEIVGVARLSIEALARLLSADFDRHELDPWSVFYRRPDGKFGPFPDFESKYVWCFVIIGLKWIHEHGLPDTRPAMKLADKAGTVRGVLAQASQDWDSLWAPLTKLDSSSIPGLGQQLLTYAADCASTWQHERDDEIVRDPIDPVKCKAFRDYATMALRNTILRQLMQQLNLIVDKRVKRGRMFEFAQLDNKEFYSVHHTGNHYAEQRGQIAGRNIAFAQEQYIMSRLIASARHVRSNKTWHTLGEYFETACEKLGAGGNTPSLFVLPDSVNYHQLIALPDFKPKPESGMELRVTGHWKDIPVMHWRGSADDFLAIDLANTMQVEEDEPSFVVSTIIDTDPSVIQKWGLLQDSENTAVSVCLFAAQRLRIIPSRHRAAVRLKIKNTQIMLPERAPKLELKNGKTRATPRDDGRRRRKATSPNNS